MKPNIRSISLVLAALLLSLFWMDRGVYRKWIVDKVVTVQPSALNHYLRHSPVIWPRIRSWDLCGHTNADDSLHPKQALYAARKWSGSASDRIRFARIAIKTKMEMADGLNNRIKKQYLADYLTLMKKGEQIDPTNALYNLLSANAMLSRSLLYVHTPGKDGNSPIRRYLAVTDWKQLHKGVRQYQLALQKQLRLHEYSGDDNESSHRSPLLLEHYETLRLQHERGGIGMMDELSLEPIVTAARYYVQKGDVATAR